METNPVLFRDLTYIFVAAVLGGLAAWRLRLPLILGFVVGGIAISPLTPGPHLSDLHTFAVFAEVGVVLLMFSIGVEFSIPDLMRVKRVALIGGPMGILIMLGLAVAVAKLSGWTTTQ
jgi:CPA2 family monovalent cation:H+ antiporter-2